MTKDTIREMLEQTAINTFNKILDYMDESKLKSISREDLIYIRDGFKSQCDFR